MEVLRGPDLARPPGGPSVGTLGVFDGLHLGHREVIGRTIAWARELGAASAVVTFDRHPAETLGRTPPPTILPVESRLEILEEMGIERVVLLRFDRALAETPAEEFARRVFVDLLAARGVVLGFDTRFGRGRTGDLAFLARFGAGAGFEVRVVEPVLVGGEPVKSTRVREAIQSGCLDDAARLLGRPPTIVGTVAAGEGRGRTIGFPTANVAPEHTCLPPPGVYGTRVRLGHHRGPAHLAVTNIGRRPTFGEGLSTTIEAHLLDFDGDLYRRRLVLELVQRIREERRFSSVEELRAQIARDVERFRTRETRETIDSFDASR